jgi:hypothetical protein
MMQLTTGPLEVKRLDKDQQPRVQKLDEADITLEMAKAQIGRAVGKTIAHTQSVLKDFGDPSLVKRFCDGEVPSVLARVWQRHRLELLKAMAESEPRVVVKTTFEFEERKTA